MSSCVLRVAQQLSIFTSAGKHLCFILMSTRAPVYVQVVALSEYLQKRSCHAGRGFRPWTPVATRHVPPCVPHMNNTVCRQLTLLAARRSAFLMSNTSLARNADLREMRFAGMYTYDLPRSVAGPTKPTVFTACIRSSKGNGVRAPPSTSVKSFCGCLCECVSAVCAWKIAYCVVLCVRASRVCSKACQSTSGPCGTETGGFARSGQTWSTSSLIYS